MTYATAEPMNLPQDNPDDREIVDEEITFFSIWEETPTGAY